MKLAFDAGEIDMAFTVTPEVAKMIKDDGKNVKTIDTGYQYFGIFNLNSDIMKNEKVRQAINLGINRDEYVKSLMGGRVATGFFAQYLPLPQRHRSGCPARPQESGPSGRPAPHRAVRLSCRLQ